MPVVDDQADNGSGNGEFHLNDFNIHGVPCLFNRCCGYPGCDEKASAGGTMCAMHYKRRERGSCMSDPKRERLTPWGRVVEAALELADADTEDDGDYHRREARLRMAAKRWVGTMAGRKA